MLFWHYMVGLTLRLVILRFVQNVQMDQSSKMSQISRIYLCNKSGREMKIQVFSMEDKSWFQFGSV